MPLFDAEMLTGPMTIDVKKMANKTIAMAKKLSNVHTAEITTSDGTNLRFSLKGRAGHADTGILIKDGSMSNLPAGEAYIAPVEGTAEGTLVARFSQTRKLKKPLIFEIEKGIIIKISGEKKARERLEQIFDKFSNARILAEFGIGTNEKAKRPDNILEAEKILGTIHIAFGDNSTFGGENKVPFHEDFVIFKPTVILYSCDKKPVTLINRGKTNFS
jgi:leucyl aminopeptidase (aminopeptidase T)